MLKQRVITALVLIVALMSLLLLLPAQLFALFLSLVFTLGAWEWARLAGVKDTTQRMGYAAVVLVTGMLPWWLGIDVMLGLQVLASCWWICALVLLLLHPQHASLLHSRAALLWLGGLVLGACMSALPSLLQLPGDHRFYVLWFIALIAAADIGAYFTGKAIGKHKLAPAISPNKTIEGLVGGIIATVLVALAGSRFSFALAVDQVRWYGWVLSGAVLAIISVVGDLFESLLKRQQGLKDSSSLLPGHGGVMDRLDSIVAALPFFVLWLTRAVV